MTFRVTHYGADGQRHRLTVTAPSNGLAMEFVEQLYGEARAMVAVRLGGEGR